MNPISTIRFILNHPANKGQKLRSLVRYLDWQLKCRFQDEVTFPWIGGAKLIAKKGLTSASGNYYCGLKEYEDMLFLLHFLRDQDLFLDVGANVGTFTVLASKVVGCHSVAVEPAKETLYWLEKNIRANEIQDRTFIVDKAASSFEGVLNFTEGRGAKNSVTEDGDGIARTIKCSSIDAMLSGLQCPALIKMDIEGHEHQALEGASKTISNATLKAIILETSTNESVVKLEDAGFRQAVYSPTSRALERSDGRVGRNTLFVREKQEVVSRLIEARKIKIFQKEV